MQFDIVLVGIILFVDAALCNFSSSVFKNRLAFLRQEKTDVGIAKSIFLNQDALYHIRAYDDIVVRIQDREIPLLS